MSDPHKVCRICGEDCSGRPRTKDKQGRYYCQPCYDAALEKQRAAKAAAAAPPPPPEPDPAPFDNVFVELAAASESAAGAPTMSDLCPGCAQLLGGDAVICTNCGYNRQSGKKLHVKKVKAPKEKGEGSGQLAAWLLHPLAFSVGYIAVYVLLLSSLMSSRGADGAIFNEGNATLAFVFLGWHAILAVGLNLVILVLAFREGIGTGLLTLCVPFYVLYFVYGICDNTWVRYGFTVYLLVSVLGWLPASVLQ